MINEELKAVHETIIEAIQLRRKQNLPCDYIMMDSSTQYLLKNDRNSYWHSWEQKNPEEPDKYMGMTVATLRTNIKEEKVHIVIR